MIGWQLGLAGGAIALALGFGGGYGLRDLMADADARKGLESQLAASEQARALEGQRALETYQAGLAFGREVAGVREVYKTIREEIPIYVPPSVDSGLPVGFVRLHDAAAAGRSVTPDPAGKPNDAASGLTLAPAADTITANYGTCNEIRAQLVALQDWVRSNLPAPRS